MIYNYTIRGGYNREVSKLMVDLVNFLTGTTKGFSTQNNIKFALDIIGDFIPKPVRVRKPKQSVPIPDKYQVVCKECNNPLVTSDYGHYCDNIDCKLYDIDMLEYENEK